MKRFAFALVPLLVISFLTNCNNSKTFTINWKNYDGSILKTDHVNEGTMPSYDGITPTKADDELYTYTFTGWNPEVHKADKDEDYIAKFSSTAKVYQITWKNYDDNVIKTESVKAGEMPTPPSAPTKPSSIQYTYTFKGWFPEVHKADKNQEYKAVYDETLVKARIHFDLSGGTSPSPIGDKYVSSIKAEDFFFDVTKDNYNFRGWTYNNQKVFDENGNTLYIPLLQENMTFVATYAQDVSITIIQTVQKGEDIQISDKGGVVSGAGYYKLNDEANLSTTLNVGYQFDGWYIGSALVSPQLTYVHKATQDIKIIANYRPKQPGSHILTISSRNPSYGKVGISIDGSVTYKDSATGSYAAGDTVIISALSEQTISFAGWYKTSDLNMVSNSQVYEFVMPDSDYNLYAVWGKSTVYEVKPEVADEGLGTVSSRGLYFAGESATIKASPIGNARFIGWFEHGNLLSTDATYTYQNINSNHKPSARFGGYYSVSVTKSMDDAGDVIGAGSYYGYDTVTLTAKTNTNYTFHGWYEDGRFVTLDPSYSFTMPNHDVKLTANWRGTTYRVTAISSDKNKGTTSGSGNYDYNSTVTVSAVPKEGFALKGWYNGYTLLTTNLDYTFKMGGGDVNLEARFYTVKDRQWDEKHGVIPVLNGDYITYGLFPQTHVNDATLIAELDKLKPDERGYCMYNDDYYTKVVATPFRTGYEFDDATPIIDGNPYWFKVEPIKWKILSSTNGRYLLTTDVSLFAHRYGEKYQGTKQKTDYKQESANAFANNYKYSDLRTYLNTTFYNTTFFLNSAHIKDTVVDNSAQTTVDLINPYICENTIDKVFVLSYKDLINTNYGFTSDASRQLKANDYSRAIGVMVSLADTELYNCTYFTRSPTARISIEVSYVASSGKFGGSTVDFSDTGIRPALELTI